MRFLQFCGLILLGGLVSCSWQSAPTPPPVEPQPLSPVAQFMVANATGATAVIEDETFGGEVRVTLEDAFLSAAGETCKRATLLSAQHEAEIVVICHNGQEGDGSNPGEWRLMPRVRGKGISTPEPVGTSKHPLPARREGRFLSSSFGRRSTILLEASLVFPQ